MLFRILTLTTLLTCTLSAQGILLEEHFANGSTAGTWVPGFNGNQLEPYQIASAPDGDGWVGRLQNNFSGGNVAQSSIDGKYFDDFIYTAKMYLPVDEAVYYGIEFRVDPSGLSAGYQFLAAFNPTGTRRMRFRVRTTASPAMPTTIKDWQVGDIPGGVPTVPGWHTLAVKAQGQNFWFYFDGKELPDCPASDPSFINGGIGVYLWDMSSSAEQLLVDDIRVTDLNVNLVYASPEPQSFRITGVYPNPINSCVIRAEIESTQSAHFEVSLVNAIGQKVATTQVTTEGSARVSTSLHTQRFPSGFYLLRVHSGQEVQQLPVTIVR